MAQNNFDFFFDASGTPKARGPASDALLLRFLEVDIQGSSAICRDLLGHLVAVIEQVDEQREVVGNGHVVTMAHDQVTIASNFTDAAPYTTTCKRFRAVVEDWEAFLGAGE